MDLIDEYTAQQRWRNWERYLQYLPVRDGGHVIDLGCSVGGVTDLLSSRVGWVTGVDLNNEFIKFCEKKRRPNQSFTCDSFESVDYEAIGPISGVWASFSLSYLENPQNFLTRIHDALEPGGWVALVDVSCFLSGNMARDARHHDSVREFELNSWKSGHYDFDFGSKMESMLKLAGFNVIHYDDNVTDAELNDSGPASREVINNWRARLERLDGLRNAFPVAYEEVCSEILSFISSPPRTKRNNVKFAVGRIT
ncbi:trans-aconitate 2-methyltransferase [Marinimicrobium sp. ABcell2]|uniref:class I SAM-dependent methyltransferase n=1 Tax=Marinimicrobium sp. ABcell2 TaxID=3069751 RepID=UPI0027AE963F|nr:class I SAM-dependent methyltransferase [Marinimicrobium sp. ABcell2]MDQ2077820.1 class I SAM-dependent methyltransferase [Marinimicrobium sp. ABcell2]